MQPIEGIEMECGIHDIILLSVSALDKTSMNSKKGNTNLGQAALRRLNV